LKLSDLPKIIDIRIKGDSNFEVSNLSSPNNPQKNTIVYLDSIKKINKIIFSIPVVILLDEKFEDQLKELNLNYLFAKNAKLEFSKLTHYFKREVSNINTFDIENYHESVTFGKNTFVGNNVKIGRNAVIQSNVVIEDDVIIGANSHISNNAILMHGVMIGDNSKIGPGSIIGSEGFGNVLLSNSTWFHICHLGSVEIGNNVSIGSNCTIDRGTIENTIIQDGVIIDNLVHIAHNVNIGENTAIAAKVGIAGSCNIGKRNMIGGMVGIVDHIITTDDVVISATSTVNKDLKEPGVYTGIMPISKHINWKRIALWITKLDKIAKLINFKKN